VLTAQVPADLAQPDTATVVTLRDDSITILARMKILDADQVYAALRFRSAFEVAADAVQESLGFREWRSPGRPAPSIAERRAQATHELGQARHLLGSHGYWLLGRIAGQGHSVRELGETRRDRDTLTDILKLHLTALAELWADR
jgi:hypothetical protein